MSETTFGDVIKAVRVSVVAEVCGLTPKAVYKWLERGTLPRTEFTGETEYADKIAKASGGKFSAAQIRRIGKQQLVM
ncbi:Cro/Cl family transcriptional regulator [Pectobacterium brasiliense]|uniref:Cro/Cl family transcriptional regulator n=1 Tax=Pectobacterium brasiliense TaxID=180957 RepID=UPI000B963CA8|nr:Cro/Cl family transcriptional regulator [Pectobacterium carotovorum]OYN49427.1 Cro/Cl family transcriptional regulator [Pectobacterium carotovorum]